MRIRLYVCTRTNLYSQVVELDRHTHIKWAKRNYRFESCPDYTFSDVGCLSKTTKLMTAWKDRHIVRWYNRQHVVRVHDLPR